MDAGVKKRRYDASGRRRQARETRRRIVEVARELFVQRGYATTTVADVAAAAGVSVETVYAGFRTKSNLLKLVWDQTIAGDDEPVPIMERPAILAIRTETDPDRALRRYAEFVAEIAPRTHPVLAVVAVAAVSDPAVGALAAELANQRLTGMTAFARQLAASGRLAVEEDEARDLLWSLNSPQFYDLIVLQRGWSLQRYAGLLGETWSRVLLH